MLRANATLELAERPLVSKRPRPLGQAVSLPNDARVLLGIFAAAASEIKSHTKHAQHGPAPMNPICVMSHAMGGQTSSSSIFNFSRHKRKKPFHVTIPFFVQIALRKLRPPPAPAASCNRNRILLTGLVKNATNSSPDEMPGATAPRHQANYRWDHMYTGM